MMVGILAARAAAGGTLVVLFSLISEAVKPKALASLAITVLAQSPAEARQASIGMVAGAVGMAACCTVAAAVIPASGPGS